MNRYCTKCGNLIDNGKKKFCDKCGAMLDPQEDMRRFTVKKGIVLPLKKICMWGAWLCVFFSGVIYVYAGINNIQRFFEYNEQNGINNWKVHFVYIFLSTFVIAMSWLEYIVVRNKNKYLFTLIVSCLALFFSVATCCSDFFLKLLLRKDILVIISEIMKMIFNQIGKYGCLLGMIGLILSIMSVKIKENV